MYRGKLLNNKLLTQGYCKPRLIKLIKMFYNRHHEIVDKFGCFCVENDLGRFKDPIFSSLVFIYLFCNIHVRGVSTKPGGAYSSGGPHLPFISEVHVFTQFVKLNVLRIYVWGILLWYCCALILRIKLGVIKMLRKIVTCFFSVFGLMTGVPTADI